MTATSTSTAAISVAEYSARIARALRAVGGGVVEGEVQKPKSTPGGMLVFDLTDGTAKLACKVFRSQVAGLQHQPRHGDLVQVCIERPDLWAQAGKLDVIVSDILLAGEGELLRRREELLLRLTTEGLCDPERRQPLPRFPRAVGVIAGKSSDGLRDVVAALQSRFPPVHIVTCDAVVQGARAPLDIIDALARLDAHPLVDVIVIARGGGSVQDLVAFDDERLCRAVSACDTPVVAAIGHTDNVPVCNHVAWAAETPSRSPELAVPSAASLGQDLDLAAAMLAPVPTRVRAFVQSVAGVQLDVAGIISARCAEVAERTSVLREAEHKFFAARETGLANAREALAAVPGRIPDIAAIAALAGRLDTCAVTFFAQRAESIRATAEFTAAVRPALTVHAEAIRESTAELQAVTAALAARAQDVALAGPWSQSVANELVRRRNDTEEQGRRLGAGIRKELADHLHDYGRALPRHADAVRDAAQRRVAAETDRVEDTRVRVGEAAARRIADAKRSLDHMTALLAASDPRHRGWVLPTDPAGAVVRSALALALGDRLTLSFHDGAAGAVIDNIPDQEEV
jgi:exodeoxyribonuclease VII large subunit